VLGRTMQPVSMPEEVGPAEWGFDGKPSPHICEQRFIAPAKRVRSSRTHLPSFCAANAVEHATGGVALARRPCAARAATRLACERRIMPSSSTWSALAASVVPGRGDVHDRSAVPAAGAPSVAPELSTMRTPSRRSVKRNCA